MKCKDCTVFTAVGKCPECRKELFLCTMDMELIDDINYDINCDGIE